MQHILNRVSSMHTYSHLLVDPFLIITSYVDSFSKLGLFIIPECLLKRAFVINTRLVVIDGFHYLILISFFGRLRSGPMVIELGWRAVYRVLSLVE